MLRREHFLQFKQLSPLVLPSLLLCDFANLEREVRAVEDAGVKVLHLDVMDGCFVPNMTYGMPLVAACDRITESPLDVHLMITQPSKYIEQFYEAGAACITIHVEATEDPAADLGEIRKLGAAAGIALNPGTDLSRLDGLQGLCDLVLVMSVEAGFGGQTFDPRAPERLAAARQMFGSDVVLEVDGGINNQTIGQCAKAGAEMMVVGSAIFRQPDYAAAVSELLMRANN